MDPSFESQTFSSSSTAVLGNPLLLRLIFGHLPPYSAMDLRLVNRMWNQAAIPALKKHGPIMTVESRDGEAEVTQLQRALEFVDCIKSSPNFPFTKLTIQLSSTLNGHAWNVVLRTVAPFLSHLVVTGLAGYHLEVDPSFPWGTHFPQLEELIVIFGPPEDEDEEEEPLFLSGIIAASPNLRDLEISNGGPEVFHLLTHQPHLKLENLALEFQWTVHHHEDVANLLISQGNNLRQLSLSAPDVRHFLEVETLSYTLPKVKTLHLEEQEESEDEDLEDYYDYDLTPDADLRIVEYANKFPNLETVQLRSLEGLNFRNFLAVNTGVPSTSVTSLELGHLTAVECQDEMVKYVPKLFPNLTSLEVTHGFKKVLELVAKLEHLETLRLTCYSKDDTLDPLLGGLDLKDWHKYGRLSRQPFGVVKDFRQMMDQSPYSAWHRIRVLTLHYYGNLRFPVSETTSRLVLLQMRNLQQVHFQGRHPNESEISLELMRQMEAKFTVFFP